MTIAVCLSLSTISTPSLIHRPEKYIICQINELIYFEIILVKKKDV
jgi:hypothetical protein